MKKTPLALLGLLALALALPAHATRNSAGTYSLATGNPVITGTVITSTWANATMADLKLEMTNSLSRDGYGAMRAPLRVPDGSKPIPSLAFDNDRDSGLYLAADGDVRMSVATTDIVKWTTSGLNTMEPLTCSKGSTVTNSTSNGAGVTATGNGTGAGVASTGGTNGASVGVGVSGTGGTPTTGNTAGAAGVSGTGGVGVGTGVGGVGVSGTGGAAPGAAGGAGGVFTGGAPSAGNNNGGAGVMGTGGAASGTGTGGNGVVGMGTGAGTGVSGTGGATNGAGMSGAGTGTGNGFIGTGGSSGAAGGQSSTGVGVKGTGGGSGPGMLAIGGTTNGDGVIAFGVGTGRGVNVVGGTGGGAGGIFTPGITATSGTPQNAVVANGGYYGFSSTTSPASTTAISNTLTPKNIVKVWAKMTANNTATPTINAGFNIASASAAAAGITVTFAQAFANANYVCSGGTEAGDSIVSVMSKTTTTMLVKQYDTSPAGYIDPSTCTGCTYDVMCVGEQ